MKQEHAVPLVAPSKGLERRGEGVGAGPGDGSHTRVSW
jgi:hypothetical protein